MRKIIFVLSFMFALASCNCGQSCKTDVSTDSTVVDTTNIDSIDSVVVDTIGVDSIVC